MCTGMRLPGYHCMRCTRRRHSCACTCAVHSHAPAHLHFHRWEGPRFWARGGGHPPLGANSNNSSNSNNNSNNSRGFGPRPPARSSSSSCTLPGTTKGPSWERMSSCTVPRSRSSTLTDLGRFAGAAGDAAAVPFGGIKDHKPN